MNPSPEQSPPTGPPLVPPQDLVRPETPPPNTFNVASPPLIQQTLPGPNQLPPPALPPNNLPPGPPQQPNQQIQDLQSQLEKAQRREARYERRMDRAGNTMERMDHKDALYHDLGILALTNVGVDHGEYQEVITSYDILDLANGDALEGSIDAASYTGAPAGCRAEEVYSRMPIYRDGAGNIVGERHPQASQRQIAENTASGEPARTRSFFERWTDRRMEKRGRKAAEKGAYSHRLENIFGQYETENSRTTTTERISSSLQSSVDTHNNRKTARQNNTDKQAAKATRNISAKSVRKRQAKLASKHERKAARAVNQPILRRWRNMRRNRAIGKIQGNHQKAEQQRELIDDLNNQINNLQNTP